MPLKSRTYSKMILSEEKSNYKCKTDHQQLKQRCKGHSASLISLISFQKGKSRLSRDTNFEKFRSSILVSRREFNKDPSLTTPLISLSSIINNRHCSQCSCCHCFWGSFSVKGSLLPNTHPCEMQAAAWAVSRCELPTEEPGRGSSKL